jgi:hypothetical protein
MDLFLLLFVLSFFHRRFPLILCRMRHYGALLPEALSEQLRRVAVVSSMISALPEDLRSY